LVRNDLGVDVPVEHFLTAPTISDLAATIHHLLTAASPAPAQPVVRHASRWVTYPRPNAQSQVRLFCFPYAGGGASIFWHWVDALPRAIELCPIQLPGREERLQEEPFTDLSSLVEALLPMLRPHLDTPFAFFGHSMGAMIGYEVTRQLQKQHDLEPVHLFISSRSAPQLVDTATPLRFLPATSFMDELQRLYGAVPDAIRQHPELQDVFLPILRADVTLLETHTDVPDEPFKIDRASTSGTVTRKVRNPSVSPRRMASTRCEGALATGSSHST
jgi:surfactin synthase thioesterase subunit